MLKYGSIEGATVMITGGGTGLGRGFALRFAEAGATVALVARNVERLEAVAAEVRAEGGRALVHPADIRDAQAVQKVVDTIVAESGRLDVLLNNAAGNFVARAENVTPNGWNAVVGIVLNGSFYCARAAGKQILRQRSGKILSVVASYAWVEDPGPCIPRPLKPTSSP
jgi:NAD(P)-dependent dehydrogenase (short-subunit alcohol dehydrogenase family)